MAAVLVFYHKDESKDVPVPEGHSISIGRGDMNEVDLRVNHRSISRVHARLELRGSDWFVKDLNSRNGTKVNGEKIEDETRISSGDEISFGSMKSVFKLDDEDDDENAATIVESVGYSDDDEEDEDLAAIVASAAAAGGGVDDDDDVMPALPADEHTEPATAAAAAAAQEAGVLDDDDDEDGLFDELKFDELNTITDKDDSLEKADSGTRTSWKAKSLDDDEDEDEWTVYHHEELKSEREAAEQIAEEPSRVSRILIYAGTAAIAALITAAFLYFKGRGNDEGAPSPNLNMEGTEGAVESTGEGVDGAGASTGIDPDEDALNDLDGEDSGGPSPDKTGVLDGEGENEGEGENNGVKGNFRENDIGAATPVVRSAARGRWSTVEIALLDLSRQVDAVNKARINEIQEAARKLPEERQKSIMGVKAWLADHELEWVFAGGKAAAVLNEPSVWPQLFQAARRVSAARAKGSADEALAGKTIEAIVGSLRRIAPVEKSAEFLKVALGPGGAWVREVMIGMHEREPIVVERKISDYVLEQSGDQLPEYLEFVAGLEAWGRELRTEILRLGLNSEAISTRLKFVQASKTLRLKEAAPLLLQLMKTDSSSRVKRAAESALAGMGQIVKEENIGRLLKLYTTGTPADRKKVYGTLKAKNMFDQATRELGVEAAAAAREFLNALKKEGRERLLKEFYRPDGPYLKGGEDAAFEQQLKDERFTEDYVNVWKEHVWLLEASMAVGLTPKDRKIRQMLVEKSSNQGPFPGWLKGPIFILAPVDGQWKVSSTSNLAYANRMAKMLRRQKEEMRD